jgi:hypothetical protein
MSKSQEFQGAAAAEAALIEVQKKAQDRQKKGSCFYFKKILIFKVFWLSLLAA